VKQKDACLCKVPKEAEEVVFEDPESQRSHQCWNLGRVLPGQRDAALLWADFFSELLLEEGWTRSKANPTLYRLEKKGKIVGVCIVHVDDVQMAGKIKNIQPTLDKLSEKVKLQIEGPFLKEMEYENGFHQHQSDS
jgi:hypothetical protein